MNTKVVRGVCAVTLVGALMGVPVLAQDAEDSHTPPAAGQPAANGERATVAEQPAPADQPGDLNAQLAAIANEVAAKNNAKVAVAIKDATGIYAGGGYRDSQSFSTGKVPLSVVALRRNADGSADADVRLAITQSDNAAADRLWHKNGGGAAETKAFNQVLRDGGDKKTQNAGYWSMASWDVADQAQFFSRLQCIDKGPEIYALMGEVVPNQRWAFGRWEGTHIKGGWGIDGNYVSRQVGIVPRGEGWVTVAAAVQAPNPEFFTATHILDEVALKLQPIVYSRQPENCAGPVEGVAPAEGPRVTGMIGHIPYIPQAPWAKPMIDQLNAQIDELNIWLEQVKAQVEAQLHVR
ncbi:MAG: hypothetical protein SPI77_07540 [Corynebacterium sp.]|nr:hypothetical protein [Corynebacterium sp.]